MNQRLSDPATLARTFFVECEKQLRFLEQKHDFTYMSGLAEYKNNYHIVRPWAVGQDIEPHFLAMTRYEKNDTALEILYKGEDHRFEVFLYYNTVLRFTIPEMLTAARKKAFAPELARNLVTPAQIVSTLTLLAKDCKKHGKYFLEPSPKLQERAQTIRTKQTEQAVRQHYLRTVQEASTLAAKAYREKDYRQVITLLEPHRKHLPPRDLKKLDLAKKFLLSSL